MTSDDSPQSGFVELPPDRLIMSDKKENWFPMRETEWARIRDDVSVLSSDRRSFAALAWASVGVAVSGIVGFLGWLPARAALTAANRTHYEWVTVVLGGIAVLGIVAAAIAFAAAHGFRTRDVRKASQIVAEMDRIHPPAVDLTAK